MVERQILQLCMEALVCQFFFYCANRKADEVVVVVDKASLRVPSGSLEGKCAGATTLEMSASNFFNTVCLKKCLFAYRNVFSD